MHIYTFIADRMCTQLSSRTHCSLQKRICLYGTICSYNVCDTICEYLICMIPALLIQTCVISVKNKYHAYYIFIYCITHITRTFFLHVWCKIWIYNQHETYFVDKNMCYMCGKYKSCIFYIHYIMHIIYSELYNVHIIYSL